ncbi:MAG TPA: hypothetical protein VHC69_30505 [Polyangiaceae bacterium]|nr:hypothetical protein [Polyangiaceae bacterium]
MRHIGRNARATASLALVGVCAGLLIACSDDKTPGSDTGDAGPDAGVNASGGAANNSGGSTSASGGSTSANGGSTNASGGSTNANGGSTSGGATNGNGGMTASSGGAHDTDAGGEADGSTTRDGSTESSGGSANAVPDAEVDAGPFDPGTGTVLVTGTDYTGSEVAVVSRPSGTVTSNTVMPFTGDVAVVVSAGKGFILERNKERDVVTPLDQDGIPAAHIALGAALPDGGSSMAVWHNPHDVAVVGTKAFVPLYNTSQVAVLDLGNDTVASTIDLSSFLDPTDADGSIELDRAFYDASSKLVYFLADRIDLTRYDTCLDFPALLIAFDPSTNQVVGTPLSLKLESPAQAAFDAPNRRVWIASSGCADGSTRKLSGVESVDLSSQTSTIAYNPPDGVNAAGLIVFDETSALLAAYDDQYLPVWSRLNLVTGKLGSLVVPAIPDGAIADGPDAVLGVVFQTDAQTGSVTQSLVRQRISDGRRVVVQGTGLFEINTWRTTGGLAVLP